MFNRYASLFNNPYPDRTANDELVALQEASQAFDHEQRLLNRPVIEKKLKQYLPTSRLTTYQNDQIQPILDALTKTTRDPFTGYLTEDGTICAVCTYQARNQAEALAAQLRNKHAMVLKKDATGEFSVILPNITDGVLIQKLGSSSPPSEPNTAGSGPTTLLS